jgi:hypothetical protein
MSTAKQIAANRSNAAHSTGPRTEAGKLITRDNSIKHALSSRHVVLEDESSADYEQLRAALTSDYKPASSIESLLVDQIAQQSWRLSRCRTVETATYNAHRIPYHGPSKTGEVEAYVSGNRDERLAAAFHNNITEFENLRRHEAAIERAYYRAIKQLEAIQKERRKIEAATQSQQRANREIGSVLENAIRAPVSRSAQLKEILSETPIEPIPSSGAAIDFCNL